MNSTRQLDLLSLEAPLDWLPNESLYSLASRYHHLSGAVRPEVTARRLFGHSRGGFPHDLPGGLAHFSSIFNGRLGSASQIVMAHTILPALTAFRNADQREDAIAAMSGRSIGGLKARLGLLASGFGASFPLKACATCMLTDRLVHGVAYWHLDHQLPGAWVCLTHDRILRVSSSKRAGQNRFGWSLPSEGDLVDVMASELANVDIAEQTHLLRSFVLASRAAAASYRHGGFRRDVVAVTLTSRLIELGFAAPCGRLRMKPLIMEFRRAMHPVASIPELGTIAGSDGAAQAQVYRILSEPIQGSHPLRYLSMIVWLFATWDAFLERLAHIDRRPVDKESGNAATPLQSDKTRHGDVVRWIRDEGVSISQAARRAGVEVATAQAWASAAGIQPPKRPSKLRAETNTALMENLRSGMDKDQAASLAGVSISSVNRSLRTNVDLLRSWRLARYEDARTRARRQWVEALETCGDLGCSAARELARGAYAWLYRNEPEWLSLTITTIPKSNRNTGSKVDWYARDRQLSDRVFDAASQYSDDGKRKSKLSLTEILKLVPELKPKLRRREMMPMTLRALRMVLRYSPHEMGL
jgi:Tn7-like transposition protein D/TniQ